MKFLLAFLLLSGCGKRIIYTDPVAPQSQASSALKADIDDELTKLEDDFRDINVNVDLKRLPVVIAPLPFGVVGRCQYGHRKSGIFIILSPVLFPGDNFESENDLYEKEFVRVLLHEIGHCYFGRKHEAPAFLEIPGSAFEFDQNGMTVRFDKIPRSLMPAQSFYKMPKVLRKYYVAEIAGKAQLADLTVLGRYAQFRIVNSDSNTIEPAHE
jgi:hypothetical protein